MLPFYKSSLSGQVFDLLIIVDSFRKALTIASSFESSIHIIKDSKQRFIFIEDRNIAIASSYGALTKIRNIESRGGNLIIERGFFENPLHINTKEILNNLLKLSEQSKRIIFVVDSVRSMNSMLSLTAKNPKLMRRTYYVKPVFLTELVKNLGRKNYTKRINPSTLKHFELEDVFYSYAKQEPSKDKLFNNIIFSLFKGKFGDLPSCFLEINSNKLEMPVDSLPDEIISSLDLSLTNSNLNVLANVKVTLLNEEIIQVSQKAPYTALEILYDASIRFNIPMIKIYNTLMSLYEKGLINNPSEKASVNRYKKTVKSYLNENFLEKEYSKNFFLIPNLNNENEASLDGVEKVLFNLIKNRFIYSFAKPCSGVVSVFDFSLSTLFSESEISFEKTLLVDVSCSHKELFNIFSVEEGDYKARIIFKYIQNALGKQNLIEVLSSLLKENPFLQAIVLNILLERFKDESQFITCSSCSLTKNSSLKKSFVEIIPYFHKKMSEESLYKAIKIILNLAR